MVSKITTSKFMIIYKILVQIHINRFWILSLYITRLNINIFYKNYEKEKNIDENTNYLILFMKEEKYL